MDDSDYLTIEEAAKLLKMHAVTVRNHLRAGKLPGRKVGGEWRISRSGLQEFMRGEPNSPPK